MGDLLNDIALNRCEQGWVGRSEPVSWPARSPDFNPLLDATSENAFEELQQRIEQKKIVFY